MSSKSDRISDYEKELKKLRNRYSETSQIIEDLVKDRKKLDARIREIENNLSQLKPKDLTVSDHVVLRYAERHYGFPFQAIKEEIQSKLSHAENFGDLKVAGFVVKNNVVVTYTLMEKE